MMVMGDQEKSLTYFTKHQATSLPPFLGGRDVVGLVGLFNASLLQLK